MISNILAEMPQAEFLRLLELVIGAEGRPPSRKTQMDFIYTHDVLLDLREADPNWKFFDEKGAVELFHKNKFMIQLYGECARRVGAPRK